MGGAAFTWWSESQTSASLLRLEPQSPSPGASPPWSLPLSSGPSGRFPVLNDAVSSDPWAPAWGAGARNLGQEEGWRQSLAGVQQECRAPGRGQTPAHYPCWRNNGNGGLFLGAQEQ